MYVFICFKNTCNHETVTFNEALLAKAVTYATLHNYVGLVTHNSFVLQNHVIALVIITTRNKVCREF